MAPPDILAISPLEEGEWPPLEVELVLPTLPEKKYDFHRERKHEGRMYRSIAM